MVTASQSFKFFAGILVADAANHAVHLLEAEHGTFVKTLVQPQAGGLVSPQGLSLGKDSKLYVVSGATNQILRYDASTGDSIGVFTNLPHKCSPKGLIPGPDGNWFVACSAINMVLAFHAKTGQQLGVAARGGGLKAPTGLAFAPGNILYVVSSGSNSILQYAQGGYFRGAVTNELPSGFDVAFIKGRVYSTGHKNQVTVHTNEEHEHQKNYRAHVHSHDLTHPTGLVSVAGQMFVASRHIVHRFGPNGGVTLSSTKISIGRKEAKATYLASTVVSSSARAAPPRRPMRTEL